MRKLYTCQNYHHIPVRLYVEHGTAPALDRPAILLNDVVQLLKIAHQPDNPPADLHLDVGATLTLSTRDLPGNSSRHRGALDGAPVEKAMTAATAP